MSVDNGSMLQKNHTANACFAVKEKLFWRHAPTHARFSATFINTTCLCPHAYVYDREQGYLHVRSAVNRTRHYAYEVT